MEARGEGLIGILGQTPKCSYAQSVCTNLFSGITSFSGTKLFSAFLDKTQSAVMQFGTLGQKLSFQLATVKLFSGITSSQFRLLGGRSFTKFATMMFYNLTPT